MERKSWKSQVQTGLIGATLVLVAYFALTGPSGNFNVPDSAGLALQRVGDGFESMVTSVAETTEEKNREMQQVHDNYERRTADRVQENGGDTP